MYNLGIMWITTNENVYYVKFLILERQKTGWQGLGVFARFKWGGYNPWGASVLCVAGSSSWAYVCARDGMKGRLKGESDKK